MIGVEIGVVGVVRVEIGNPWVLDMGLVGDRDGDGWVWSRWRSVVGVVVFVGEG